MQGESPSPPGRSSPKRPGPRYLAGIDGIEGETLKGFAVDLQHPQAPIALRLELKGEAVCELHTHAHRADLASVLPDNIAGFALSLTASAEPLLAALLPLDPAAPAPPSLIALRVLSDNSLLDFSAFGLSIGDFLRALGQAPPAPPPPRPKPPAQPSRDKQALAFLIAHLDGAPPGGDPARRFVRKLLADIEGSPALSRATKRHARAIAPLFDPFAYLAQMDSPDRAIANPLLHYIESGWRAGLAPSPLFAPDYYRAKRGKFSGDPLLDFLNTAGADPHPLFDVAHYRAAHLKGEKINPLRHYVETGARHRLDPSPLFDTPRVLARYGLGEEVENPLETFLRTPEAYADSPLPGFDGALYRHQIEVERGGALAEPALAHYLARGFRDETLRPNLLFDPAFYREQNGLELTEPALLHYLHEGEAAGLAPHPLFDPRFYNRQRGLETPEGALRHALENPGAHRANGRMDRPLDPRLFAFARDLAAERGEAGYNPRGYRAANPDLSGLSDEEAERHYRTQGAREGRFASLTEIAQRANLRLSDIPLGLVLDDYAEIYSDLEGYKGRLAGALYHWGRYGKAEKRLVGKWMFRIEGLELDMPTREAPLHVVNTANRVEVCILIHAFYPELLPELVAFAQNFRHVTFDIFINVVDLAWTPALQDELRAICPGAFVMLSNDKGRDIGGFTRLLSHVDLARYDLFAFLHSKRSPHLPEEQGEYWRRGLLNAFAGTAEVARECVAKFQAHPKLGMIGAREWRSQEMGKNIEQYEKLLDLLGVSGAHRELDYLSGFMFLTRAAAVERLYGVLRQLDFEFGGDKDLDFHIDGQIAHGVERAFPALVREMGYDVLYR